MINAKNKLVIHHFAGMLALKSGFGIQSAIFWHLKMDTCGKMVDYKFVLFLYRFWMGFNFKTLAHLELFSDPKMTKSTVVRGNWLTNF